jgi:hypothetical protein
MQEAIPAGAGLMAWQGLVAVAGVVRHGRRKSLIGFEIRFRARSSDALSSLLRVFYVRFVADVTI